MKTTQKLMIVGTLATGFATVSAQAQYVPEDVENAVGSGTYLDLFDLGTTRNGITMSWSNFVAGAWDFPDGSNSSGFVFGDSADDKEADGGTDPIQLDFTGLDASTQYHIFLAARARPAGNDEGGDISWGAAADALSLVTFDSGDLPSGSAFLGGDPGDSDLAALHVGTLTTDASGELTLFVGEGLPFQDEPTRNRTQFDGVLLSTVPEPGSLWLLGLGGTAMLRRRHG